MQPKKPKLQRVNPRKYPCLDLNFKDAVTRPGEAWTYGPDWLIGFYRDYPGQVTMIGFYGECPMWSINLEDVGGSIELALSRCLAWIAQHYTDLAAQAKRLSERINKKQQTEAERQAALDIIDKMGKM